MDGKKIVDSIKLLCEEHNITITKLEKSIGVSQGLVSRWEKSDPSLSKVIDVAKYFHISLDTLISYEKPKADEFIDELAKKTNNLSITWNKCTDKTPHVKQFHATDEEKDSYESYKSLKNGTETSYYIAFESGFIILYGYHEYNNSFNAPKLSLFIQPSPDSRAVDQEYTTSQLFTLWAVVLLRLGDNTPDDIKASNLKDQFMKK